MDEKHLAKESNEGGRADDDDELEEVLETPVRKMPARRARILGFKDKLTDGEEEEKE